MSFENRSIRPIQSIAKNYGSYFFNSRKPISFDVLAITFKRKILFTTVAFSMVVGVPFLVLECVLALTGWQPTNETDDPFIGLTGTQSLFREADDGIHFEVRTSRIGYFRPARFLKVKPSGAMRVFVVGGSTVQGRPWETETAFSTFLELCLKSIEPGRKIEVVNCGGVSYASYRLSLIVDEIMEYSPDLIILCTGHNEFLEERTYAKSKKLSPIVVGAHRILAPFKSYQWIRSFFLGNRTARPHTTLSEKLITKLDFENGLDLFDETNLQRDQVRQHFRFNLEKMISTVTSKDVPLFILAPPSNQKDCFPFKPQADWQAGSQSTHSQKQLSEFDSPDSNEGSDFYFFRATRWMESGNIEKAKSDFDQAIDHDICPLRMTTKLRQTMRSTFESASKAMNTRRLIFVDLQNVFEEKSPRGIIGDELLVDHVHPTIAAHETIAKTIVDHLQKSELIPVNQGWETRFQIAKTEHMAKLDFGYFQRGTDRLESVKKWARGNANNPLKK